MTLPNTPAQDKLTQTEQDDIDKRLIKLGYENFSKQELGAEITALKASLQTAVAALEFVSRNDFDNFQNPDKVARIAMSIRAKDAIAKIRKDGGV